MRFKRRPPPPPAATDPAPLPAKVVLRPKQVVVPVGGEPGDEDAMRIACRLARPDRATVHALRVVEVGRNLPLSAAMDDDLALAEQDLTRVAAVARAAGVPIQTSVLQARVAGPALVDEAAARGADLFVMVVGERRRLGEVQLGRTASYILANARCNVLLLREWGGDGPGRRWIDDQPAID